MGRLVLVIGGARSGKSRYARDLATALGEGAGDRVAFIATARAGDGEMRERIERHRQARPATWQTFEEPREVAPLLGRIGNDYPVVLIDCLTLLLSNLLLKEAGREDGRFLQEEEIQEEVRRLIAAAKGVRAQVVVVSNEVGMGIVPPTRLGRAFRDVAGRANQLLAQEADEVLALWAGIPLRLKGEGPAPRQIPEESEWKSSGKP